MPHKCCVATCKGNYKNGPKVAVFSFPTEEQLRKQWIWNCKRKDGFKPTKHSKVCELHFKQEDVLRQTEFFDEKTGKKIIIPLSYPRLKNGAIPSLFPDGPSHLSSSVSSRESPEHKRLKREQDALEKALACSLAEKEEYERKQMFL
ncbi:THAP domain-containing protein 2-like [Stegodyphus dumicola]|uniref:THAP domain-containing protein 2-like n=1 Tax=Stegodyphus dumicola TaxID=202533 RepID=UPI0015A7D931|nr:THAP domain-containing protein 2-like [Stegodyphus dumicola]